MTRWTRRMYEESRRRRAKREAQWTKQRSSYSKKRDEVIRNNPILTRIRRQKFANLLTQQNSKGFTFIPAGRQPVLPKFTGNNDVDAITMTDGVAVAIAAANVIRAETVTDIGAEVEALITDYVKPKYSAYTYEFELRVTDDHPVIMIPFVSTGEPGMTFGNFDSNVIAGVAGQVDAAFTGAHHVQMLSPKSFYLRNENGTFYRMAKYPIDLTKEVNYFVDRCIAADLQDRSNPEFFLGWLFQGKASMAIAGTFEIHKQYELVNRAYSPS